MQTSGEQGADNGGTPPLLSVVVPVYNEQEVVRSFQQRLAIILDSFSEETEIIYVNDGTLAVLHELRAHDPRVAILDLSRNLGKEIAMSGYPSLLVVVLFLGGIQLAFLGVIGEYLGRMFNETKRRSLYLYYLPPAARRSVLGESQRRGVE